MAIHRPHAPSTLHPSPAAPPPPSPSHVHPSFTHSLTYSPSLPGYLAKKALNYVVPRIGDFHFHSALTLEGRDDEELPEQTLLAARIVGADLEKYGSEYEL
jgi:hypothetical protein